MKFTVCDFSDYFGYLYLTTEDYEMETAIDVSMFYDEDAEEWDDEAIRETAERTVKERFGSSATIEW